MRIQSHGYDDAYRVMDKMTLYTSCVDDALLMHLYASYVNDASCIHLIHASVC